MTKRITNYRSGDRAEALGVVLLQLFTAVAPVPRQEDFGIVDAVATLLRRDGRFVHAEDSFLLQFKSRTEKNVKFLGDRFKALVDQELPLFIARVDLTKAELSLYSVGVVLAHPNINDVKGLVVYFDAVRQEIGEILSTSLGPPVLRWSTAELANRDFETTAYTIMREWLEFDRWNRRHRRMGVQVGVEWQTNQVPSKRRVSVLWNPERAEVQLTEVVPSLQVMLSLAIIYPELSIPVLGMVSWMRGQGVDPDPESTLCLMVMFGRERRRAEELLAKHPEADVVVLLDLVVNEPGRYVLCETSGGRTRPWTERTRTFDSVDSIRAEGVKVEVTADSQKVVIVGLDPVWLSKGKLTHNVIHEEKGVFLLREVNPEAML